MYLFYKTAFAENFQWCPTGGGSFVDLVVLAPILVYDANFCSFHRDSHAALRE